MSSDLKHMPDAPQGHECVLTVEEHPSGSRYHYACACGMAEIRFSDTSRRIAILGHWYRETRSDIYGRPYRIAIGLDRTS